ncbi:small subunit ribosomal protein S13 [Prosthecobacter fusiformis]|uniref:Small ribosomal subunit protein uS13 n=1 Tax=Prosthecobacter fusiformis TaxID=48464 RepID=A0A4R7RST5_9BACT|nr:30S ribosomal protein S13 [Prosthecobacter fusiformis]TDU68199.1 small subunit ribosomal protein S13 [Prosthecobacter fusiformis]
MARLLGVEIPNEKKIEYSLPYIYGIGLPLSRKILAASNIDPNVRAGELTDDQIALITQVIQGMAIVYEGDLRREQGMHMKRLLGINCYRATRHRRGLPVRGQRTHTNSRTRKGPRKTVGAQSKPGAKKGKV